MRTLETILIVTFVGYSIAAMQRGVLLNISLRPRFVDAFSTGFVS